ncbi:hypothetical protein GCM10023080_041830 [Streptomyces pseudoechinosporeus]
MQISQCLRRLSGLPPAVGRDAYGGGVLGSWATAGPSWLVAQFPAPLKSLRLPAPRASPHPQLPAACHRREGPWAGASYARRVGSVSENQDPVPGQGRMPGLRRADAPAHGPDPPRT